MTRLALLLPIIAGACWGCCGVFIRILYEAGFDNITITFSRLTVTAAILALMILVRDRGLFVIHRRDLPLLGLIGFLGYFLMNVCYNVAINTLSLSLASVLLCTAPVFVIIFSSFLFGERITRTRLVCMVSALAGCVLLSGLIEEGGMVWSVYGILMGAGSSVCYAACTISLNEAIDVRRWEPLTVQFYTCLIAVVLMVPLVDYPVMVQFLADRPVYGGAFYIAHALVASLIPNLLFTICLRYIDPGVASILSSGAEPTAALVFGLVVYSEVPTLIGIMGMVLTVTAIIVLIRSNEKSDGAEGNEASEGSGAGEARKSS